MRAVPDCRFAAAHIVQDEGDLGHTPAEVWQEQVDDVVIGGNGGVQRAAFALQKAHEAFETMRLEGDAPHTFRRLCHGVVGEHPADGTAVRGDQTEVVEGDLRGFLLAASQKEIELAHTLRVQLFQARLAAARFFRVRAYEYALLSERKLMIARRDHGVFVAEREQKRGQEGVFAAVKKPNHNTILRWRERCVGAVCCVRSEFPCMYGERRAALEEGELRRVALRFACGEQSADGKFVFRAVKFPARRNKVPCAFEDDAHFFEMLEGERRVSPRREDLLRAARADAGNAQERFERGAVDFHGEEVHIPERPCALRIKFEGQIFRGRDELFRVEPVKP